MLRAVLFCTLTLAGQTPPGVSRPSAVVYTPPAVADLQEPAGLRSYVERYQADLGALNRFYRIEESPKRIAALRQFFGAWQRTLAPLQFSTLSQDARVDHILLSNEIRRELRLLDLTAQRIAETQPLLPFAAPVFELIDNRQRVEPIDPAKTAALLHRLDRELGHAIKELPSQKGRFKPTAANRAAALTRSLLGHLKEWNTFYSGYDPLFTWWTAEPFGRLAKSLDSYSDALRETLAGVAKADKDTIVGDPIGAAALRAELEFAFVPYTPEQLVTIAEKEFAWCEKEMLRASRDLSFGDDWRKALEHVKNLHVPPGQQTALLRDMVFEASDFVEKRALLTVPGYAKDIWRMQMMTPERQRLNPFFLGGESIIVSFPTGDMPHESKLMSMRGNNIHFSRATVHHEVIPGHHLQMYMNARHRSYRRAFSTPFWMEGWALYWEMRLWDLGFPATPENRIGMLFWRMHRCARILFSLSFHLEKMTAKECVDFLVERVGHERENAAGEVRRSFESSYEPLYQAAYMLGGLQFRALHGELVKSGRMTEKQFHDSILKLGTMPVELVRASLTQQALQPDFRATWRFYGDL